MFEKAVIPFLCVAALVLVACTPEEPAVLCVNNDDCAVFEYCYIDGSLTDEYGAPIGECVAAVECDGGSCDTGYDCIDGYCKPSVNPPQDQDQNVGDDAPVTADDAPVVTGDDAPVVTDDAPVVTDDTPVVTDDAPVATDDAPVATDDGAVSDDDTILTDETPDTVEADILPDADVNPATFTAEFTSPGDGATTNVVRPDLVITFSHPVEEATLTTGGGCEDPVYVITIVPAVTINVDTSALSADGKVLTIKLSQDLTNNTTYTVTVPNSIEDTSGAALSQTYNWTLKTDFTKPTAMLTTPSPLTNVPVDTAIEVTFSEAMDVSTIVLETSFTIVGSGGAPAVTGTPVWSAGDTVWTLQPDSDLETDTTYTVTLKNTIADGNGNTMNEAVFAFTTTDTIAPTVLSTVPVDKTDPASITLEAITVLFSEKVINIDETTMTVERTGDGSPVIGVVSLSTDGLTATFAPAAPLEDTTEYTVTLNPDGATPIIADPAGNPLTGNSGASYVFGFTTGASICNDGYKTGPEACDDGNNDDGDYCAADCLTTADPGLVAVVSSVTYESTPVIRYCPNSTTYLGTGNRNSGRYCGNSQTDYTISLGRNRAYMTFYSDSGTTGTGFELWSGAPGSSTLLVKYPASGSYSNYAEQAWRLNAVDLLNNMTLRILNVEENGGTSCYDYVKFFYCDNFTHTDQGVTSDCDLRGLYTGTGTPPALANYPTDRMFVRLTSDASTQDDGWQLTANGTTYQCTPYNNYSANMNQVVPIVSDTAPIALQFTTLRTESTYDFVYLYTCPPQ
ncbi:MAG TPA: Ig-like domain-containing protein [bacterium]|nr:Ig-like domain-containing protein [bacterium]